MNTKLVAATVLIVGFACAGGVVLFSPFKTLGIIVGAATLFAAGSLLSNAGRLSSQLRPFIGKSVTAKVWGTALASAGHYEAVSIRGLGAGLLIHLRPLPDGKPTLLKVAQPAQATVDATSLQIQQAAYVQWEGSKVKRPADATAAAFSMWIVA